MSKIFTAIGLMSGTSMDGIDAAIIRTDGENLLERVQGAALHKVYSPSNRKLLAAALEVVQTEGETAQLVKLAASMINIRHAQIVKELLQNAGLEARKIDMIGFHGHTILHRPEQAQTLQIGDGGWLSTKTGIPVVADLRQADIKAGGQGAPLVPVYHQALVKQAGLELPVAVLNVGGVANVTYIGTDGELIAFDTGPGNALIDDWVKQNGAGDMDKGGEIAAKGRVKESVLAALLNNSYFSQDPPKSLDRNHFSLERLEGISLEWGAMTLTSFTALATSRADFFFPAPPNKWVICGGGVHNPVLMAEFQKRLSGEILSAEDLGWSSDFMEAEAFAYLAVRSLKGLPLTFPGTTGVEQPQTGGVLFEPQK
ncbi:MAG: anhydro-N-acetylmuramic acid kinase [Hyphomicrobiaceae bacterium]|nr:anhydro-N-acetylmuramic acid kinase [Hyphomicrobiaceae bacterium]